MKGSAIKVCGRPTSTTGRPCQQPRPIGQVACRAHLTADERAAVAARDAEHPIDDTWLLGMALGPDPACWAWPVTDEVTAHLAALATAETPMQRAEHFAGAVRGHHQGRCALCGHSGERLIEDHDHRTGLVRGWLCRSCNAREGHQRWGADDVFARYRRRPPYVILGLVERYDGFGWTDGRWVGDAERMAR